MAVPALEVEGGGPTMGPWPGWESVRGCGENVTPWKIWLKLEKIWRTYGKSREHVGKLW